VVCSSWKDGEVPAGMGGRNRFGVVGRWLGSFVFCEWDVR
jgi:hypothetical protein